MLKIMLIKDLLWIVLVNWVNSLNVSHKANVDVSPTMSSFGATLKEMCDPTSANFTAVQDLNTSSRTANISCMASLLEVTEENNDVDVLKKIQYYNYLERRIWAISPPILLGKVRSLKLIQISLDQRIKCLVCFNVNLPK